MVNLAIYTAEEVPKELHGQIISFLKIQWPDGFSGVNKFRDWIARKEFHPLYFVLVEEKNIVVGFTAVVWKYLTHKGKTYKTYGLSGVFTYPAFRMGI